MDQLLLVRCQLGEREALTELVRAWHQPIWSYARRMLGPARADDVTQEIWLAVLRGLPRLRDTERFRPWLFTIARRSVVNALRSSYGEPGQEPVEPVMDDPADTLLDRVELVEGLAKVPAREREVLILFYLEDLSLEDCAEICAVPVGTVKSRLNRARRLLRTHLTENP
ncbi:RNA polymerase sigma factor [Nonomuraea sediminis]|uniref:RNA polymerase sigma factor n=1 Tax=Nonomuraea sediminis TaxID=2835864 RepID=UPI0027DEBAC3|nr:sigma-70 family RNA polymerase sigma factor [Nonomuraea sediminis]